jgi:hypothetical protein
MTIDVEGCLAGSWWPFLRRKVRGKKLSNAREAGPMGPAAQALIISDNPNGFTPCVHMAMFCAVKGGAAAGGWALGGCASTRFPMAVNPR